MPNPHISFFLVLLLVVGSMAKGRGGGAGGSGSGSIHDSWDVLGTIKAAMAFEIIFFVIILFEFIAICWCLRLVPSGRHTRAPYILLAVVAGTLALSYLLSAIVTRISPYNLLDLLHDDHPFEAMRGLNAFEWFLKNIDTAFRPAICLWIIHLRGNLTQRDPSSTSIPWVAQLWKRIVDWLLVAIVFSINTSWMGIIAKQYWTWTATLTTNANFFYYMGTWRGLNATILFLDLLLTLNVIVSLIGLWLSNKRMMLNDPISSRLLVAVLPFLAIEILETLIIPIYWNTTLHAPAKFYVPITEAAFPERSSILMSFYTTELVGIIISGLCRVGVIGGLLSTMMIPNVKWLPAVPSDSIEAPGSMLEKVQQSYQPWQISQHPQTMRYQPPQYPPPNR